MENVVQSRRLRLWSWGFVVVVVVVLAERPKPKKDKVGLRQQLFVGFHKADRIS
jgi:hypothetical protein